MTQRRISNFDDRQEVAFFLTQDPGCSTCNDCIVVAHTREEAIGKSRQTEADLVVADQCRPGVREAEIARPFIIHLFTQLVRGILHPSPTGHVLTTPDHLRNSLPDHYTFPELQVPLTHTLSRAGALSQEGDNPQDDLARDPHRAISVWNGSDDPNQPGEGPIKEFPGYLQTFNLHHIPP